MIKISVRFPVVATRYFLGTVVPLTGSTSETRISNNGTPSIQIELTDDSGLDLGSFSFKIDGVEHKDDFDPDTCTGTPVTCIKGWINMPLPSPGADGNYLFEANVQDMASNTGTAILTYELDTTAPEISITGFPPAIGDFEEPPFVPIITITDAHEYTANILLNGEPFVSGTPLVRANRYVLDVTATDVVGNSSQAYEVGALDAHLLFSATKPELNATVSEINPLFEGTFESYIQHDGLPAQVSVRLNGQPTILIWDTPTSGRWMSKNIFLKPGLNEVCIDFNDYWGNFMETYVYPCYMVTYKPTTASNLNPAPLQLELSMIENISDSWLYSYFSVHTPLLKTHSFCIDYNCDPKLEEKPQCDEEIVLSRGNRSFQAPLYESGLIHPTAFIYASGIQYFSTNLAFVYTEEEALDYFCGNIYEPFLNALSNDQLELALLYLHPNIRDHYRQYFRTLKDQGIPINSSIWPTCDIGSNVYIAFDNQTVILTFADEDPDVDIVFIRDGMGHWRISSL